MEIIEDSYKEFTNWISNKGIKPKFIKVEKAEIIASPLFEYLLERRKNPPIAGYIIDPNTDTIIATMRTD